MTRLFWAACVAFVCATTPVLADYFRLDGNQLWLQANRMPMTTLLEHFADAGVEVTADPNIRDAITVTYRGKDLDQALAAIFRHYNYILEWRTLRGPLGHVPKLRSIQLSGAGGRQSARPLQRPSRVFPVATTADGREYVPNELLIGVRPGTTYDEFKVLLNQIGGMIVDADPNVGVYLIRFPPGTDVEALLKQLANNAMVAHAELNGIHRTIAPTSMEGSGGQPALANVSPPLDGSSPVAVLDTGLNTAAGLAALTHATLDATDPTQPISDTHGHGTQMAMLAAGALSADGLALPDGTTPLVAIRTMDHEGKTSNFALMQAIAYAQQAGVKVINMSWGSNHDSAFIQSALQKAVAADITLIAAAGNSGNNTPHYPAAYDYVLAIGGVNGLEPWSGSNYGDYVNLSASAKAVFPEGTYAGTSISAAVVANAVAQYRNRNPGATAGQTEQALLHALTAITANGYGAGVLDANALARFLK